MAVSVIAGARLIGRPTIGHGVGGRLRRGSGGTVAADDLTARRVRFVDAGDLDRYFPADEELPADLRLQRGVGAGELLPRSAVDTSGGSDAMELPVAVETTRVPPGVQSGWVVDVYVVEQRSDGARRS